MQYMQNIALLTHSEMHQPAKNLWVINAFQNALKTQKNASFEKCGGHTERSV